MIKIRPNKYCNEECMYSGWCVLFIMLGRKNSPADDTCVCLSEEVSIIINGVSMSFQKHLIIILSFVSYLYVSPCSSTQDAKLVKVSEWGSNFVTSAISVDNKYLFFEYGQSVVDVYDPLLSGKNAYVNKIKFQKPLSGNPLLFQGKLVTFHNIRNSSGYSLNIYSVENLSSPILQHSIDVGDIESFNTLNTYDNKLAYVNPGGEIFILEDKGDSYVVIPAPNSQFKSEYGTGYNIRQKAVGFDGDILYLATLKEYTTGTSNKELSVEKFELSEGKYTLVSTTNTRGLVNSVNQLIYLKKGMFAVDDDDDGIYIFAEKNSKLSLIHKINDITAFRGTMTYGNDQLWIIYPNYTMRSYKINLFDLEKINDVSLETSYTKPISVHNLQLVGDDLLVVSYSKLIKINVEQGKYKSNKPLFHTGAPISGFTYKNKRLYVPSPNNINVLNIDNPITPILEAQVPINSQQSNAADNLYATGDNISHVHFTGFNYGGFLSYRLESNIPILDTQLITQQPFFSDSRRLKYGNSLFIGIDGNKIARFNLNSKDSLAESPHYSEFIEFEGEYSFAFRPVAVSGNFLYVRGPSNKNLHILKNPFEDIEFVGKQVFESSITTISGHKDLIIIGEHPGKIKILSPQNNGMLEIVSQIDGLNYSPHIKIFGDYIITITNGGYLRELYDISEPKNPKLVYSTELFKEKLRWYDDNDLKIGEYFYTQTALGLISIFQINKRPTFDETDYVIDEDSILEVNLTGLDPEQDVMSVEVVQEPVNGVILFDSENQRYSYSPNPDFVGEDSTELKLFDPHGNYAKSTISIIVAPINDPPIANDLNFKLEQDTSIEESLYIVDPDDDIFVISVIREPDSGTLNVNLEGSFNYRPNVGFYGKDSFSLSIEDNSSAEVTIQVSLTILQVNNPPIAEDVNVELTEGNNYAGTLLKEDGDGDKLSYELQYNAENGIVTITPEGEYTFIPNIGFFGKDKFTYEVTDTFNNIAIGVVYLTVKAKPAVAPPTKSDSSGGSLNIFFLLFLLFILIVNTYYFQSSRVKLIN